MTKLKTEQEQTEMTNALADAQQELQDLAGEMGDWRDNVICKSPAYEKLLDECLEVISKHLDTGKKEVLA